MDRTSKHIRRLRPCSPAAPQLPQTFTDIAVTFFAERAFNKLYSICSPHIPSNILCASPYRLNRFTRPRASVPNVIAYNSSSENPLGFEWMLYEKIEGGPLSDVWKKMDFDFKVRWKLEISNLLQQQHDLEFSQIGNVYFAIVATQVNNRIGTSSNADTFGGRGTDSGTLKVDSGIGADFVIGRMVSPWFSRDQRVLLPADRGPFSSSHELIMAKTQIQIERVSNLSPHQPINSIPKRTRNLRKMSTKF